MWHRIPWLVAALIAVPLLLMGCGGGSSEAAAEEECTGPACVTLIEGTELSTVTLTEKAAERLAIETAAVEKNGVGRAIPYSAVLYSPTGETWAYVSPKPLTFVRHAIVVDRIDGNKAFLSEGPTAGTKVATVGVSELYGAASGLGQ
jgi:hypothetical protein